MNEEETSTPTDEENVFFLNRLKFVTPYLTFVAVLAIPFYFENNWYFLFLISWFIGWNLSLPTVHIGDGCLPIVILLMSYFFNRLLGPISWQMGLICWLTWYIVSVEMYYKIVGRASRRGLNDD